MEDPFREELVRQLIGQAAESRGLDYKGPMAWAGSRAERAELIRDLVCFSNTPDGGYILVGVEEVLQAGYSPVSRRIKQRRSTPRRLATSRATTARFFRRSQSTD